MYKVIAYFTDLQDNDYRYLPGNEYPRKGYTPSPERIRELSTSENSLHYPLIESDGKEITENKPEEIKEPIEEIKEATEEVSEEATEKINAVPDDFMNPPIEEEPVTPKKRGRKKNAD